MYVHCVDARRRAWDEIQEVFGDGHDYDEALESEDEEEKPQKTIRDVFEPSEIAERMMTDADDIIRAIDIPERMQIAQAGIAAKSSTVSADGVETTGSDLLLEPDQIDEAARWVSTRISDRLTDEFIFSKDGREPALREPFMAVMRDVLRFMCCEYYEVPFIWVHRRDFFIYHNPDALTPAERSRSLLGREDLWKVYSLAIKYRALLDRKESLLKLWQKLNVDDHYFSEMFEGIDSLEEAADLVEYVTLKYRREIKALAANSGAAVIPEDAEADAVRTGADGVKYKRATSTSKYETAKDSLAAKFAEVRGIDIRSLTARKLIGNCSAHNRVASKSRCLQTRSRRISSSAQSSTSSTTRRERLSSTRPSLQIQNPTFRTPPPSLQQRRSSCPTRSPRSRRCAKESDRPSETTERCPSGRQRAARRRSTSFTLITCVHVTQNAI